MKNERRSEYTDFFRGLGILLMVMNHVDFGGVLYNFSHAFHVPMFFIISGFLFSNGTKRRLSTKAFLKKKARALLLPYCVFGLAHYLIWIALYGFSLEPLKYLFFFNTEGGMPIAGALWFLTALFIADILFFVLDRYLRNRRVFVSAVVCLSLLGTTARRLLPFPPPFALDAGFVGVGLFGIGVLLRRVSRWEAYKRYEALRPVKRALLALLLGAITGALIFLNGGINMRSGKYSMIPLFWINATLATVTGLVMSRLWLDFVRIRPLNRYICSVGRESIVYLCLNQLVILFAKNLVRGMGLPFMPNQIAVMVVTMGVLYLVCRISFRSRLKWVFGK